MLMRLFYSGLKEQRGYIVLEFILNFKKYINQSLIYEVLLIK